MTNGVVTYAMMRDKETSIDQKNCSEGGMADAEHRPRRTLDGSLIARCISCRAGCMRGC
jgi:hypothetical protein